jgi:amino acid permease
MAEVDETQKVDRSSVLDEKGVQTEEGPGLHRGLQARHITMIAIGGAIGSSSFWGLHLLIFPGTGLIIGTGATLAKAGYVNDV